MSGEHAFLAPSSAPIWGHCPGSAALAPLFPEEETDASREGTAAHWYAEKLLSGMNPADRAPNGVIVSQEMKDAAMVYVTDVQRTVADYNTRFGSTTLGIEQRGHARTIHPEHCWGTRDASLHIPKARRIILWDFKGGHREVDPVENLQLITYATMLIEDYEVNGLEDQTLVFEFRIVQPRCFTADGPIRTWCVKACDLRGYINQLHSMAHEALRPDARTISGSHCFYCPARAACATSRRSAMACVEYIGKASPEPLSLEGLSFEYTLLTRAEEQVKARLAGLEVRMTAEMKARKTIPGYEMKPTEGRLDWLPEITVEQIDQIGKAYQVELVKREPITPTQAKAKGIDEAVINIYAKRPSRGMKMVATDMSKIIRILSGVTP